MLADILKEYLLKTPHKISNKDFTFAKDLFFKNQFSLIDEQVQQSINKLSYSSLKDFLDNFEKIISIDLSIYRSTYEELLQEIKESRNLLVHNDLKINSIYLSKAGPKARERVIDTRINISSTYFKQSIEVLYALCDSCEKEITEKYKKYTNIKAIRSLWDYIFTSPIFTFEEWWDVDESMDSIYGRGKADIKYYGNPSSSEKIFLSVWFNHYFGEQHDYYKYFSMKPLDDENKEKILWLISVLRNFRVDTD